MLLSAAARKASTPTRTPVHTPTPSVTDGEVALIIEEGETKAEGALDVSQWLQATHSIIVIAL